ncbi:MAG: Gfo/Idh/MocA family oxidoreductase [Lentisphaerae bacterium]|nr:Gfo/Idh/MocA family oxidoreductase [Lentisphaerota bacterium]
MSKVKVAIVGIGGRGSWLVGAVAKRADVEIVALCDRIVKRAEYMAQKCQLASARIFTDIHDLLASVDCDAVMVTTSDAHHCEVVLPALKAGKFVFCEKPLEISLKACRDIIAADRKAGGKTFVGFNLRYAPVYAKVKEVIDSGRLGKLLTIQADEFYDGGRTYFRRWNRFRSEGGGLWITKASHDFDLLAWFAGAKPVEVYAAAEKTYYVPRPGAAMQCRDCQFEATCPDRAPREAAPLVKIREEAGGEPHDLCLFNAPSDTFDHGIATVTFEGDILATYTCNVVAGFSDRRIRVAGTKAAVEGSLSGKTLTLRQRDPSASTEIPIDVDLAISHGGADGDVQDSFFRFVRGAGEPKCRPQDAFTPVCLGLAATLSGDTHRAVSMARYRL